jgi:hypothetical protein
VLLLASCGPSRSGGGGIVTPPPPVTKLTLTPKSVTLKVGETQLFTVVAENATSSPVFSIKSGDCGTLNNDLFSAQKSGECVIEASAKNQSGQKVSVSALVVVTGDFSWLNLYKDIDTRFNILVDKMPGKIVAGINIIGEDNLPKIRNVFYDKDGVFLEEVKSGPEGEYVLIDIKCDDEMEYSTGYISGTTSFASSYDVNAKYSYGYYGMNIGQNVGKSVSIADGNVFTLAEWQSENTMNGAPPGSYVNVFKMEEGIFGRVLMELNLKKTFPVSLGSGTKSEATHILAQNNVVWVVGDKLDDQNNKTGVWLGGWDYTGNVVSQPKVIFNGYGAKVYPNLLNPSTLVIGYTFYAEGGKLVATVQGYNPETEDYVAPSTGLGDDENSSRFSDFAAISKDGEVSYVAVATLAQSGNDFSLTDGGAFGKKGSEVWSKRFTDLPDVVVNTLDSVVIDDDGKVVVAGKGKNADGENVAIIGKSIEETF